jgi:hypothetical protein
MQLRFHFGLVGDLAKGTPRYEREGAIKSVIIVMSKKADESPGHRAIKN